MAQIVYYVWAAQQPDRRDTTTFCVPTGNFGNVFAGHCARRMGLPSNGCSSRRSTTTSSPG